MLVVLAAGCFIMAAASTLPNLRGAHMRAVTQWAVASYIQALAWALYALRGMLPDVISTDAAFACLTGAYALYIVAIYSFSEARAPWPALAAVYLAGVALHSAFYASAEDQRWRIVVASLLIGPWMLLCALSLFRLARPAERLSYWMTGGFFCFLGFATVYRGFDTLFSPHPTMTLLTVNLMQTITFACGYVTVIGTSLGFIMMTKERADSELQRIASVDSLTGLSNRRTFEEAARKELARAKRESVETCVLMCDLDHFKDVNDTYGHPTGDLVLATFGRVLRENLRPFDIVGRYGGEEFCIVLPATNAGDAASIAERIRQTQSEASVVSSKGMVGCTVSIGIAAIGNGGEGLEVAVKRADDALYAAKAAGRNCVKTTKT